MLVCVRSFFFQEAVNVIESGDLVPGSNRLYAQLGIFSWLLIFSICLHPQTPNKDFSTDEMEETSDEPETDSGNIA